MEVGEALCTRARFLCFDTAKMFGPAFRYSLWTQVSSTVSRTLVVCGKGDIEVLTYCTGGPDDEKGMTSRLRNVQLLPCGHLFNLVEQCCVLVLILFVGLLGSLDR